MPIQNEFKRTTGGNKILKSFYIDFEMWEAAKRKAGLRPLAAIIRRLIALWLAGEITDNLDE